MIYDKIHGMDSVRSSVKYCKEIGLLGGNRNGYYFGNHKEEKFTLMNMNQDFRDNRNLYKVMYDTIIPELSNRLSAVSEEEMIIPEEEFNY